MDHPVLMTGGSSGVGKATAALLLARGHEVVSLDVKLCGNSKVTHHYCDLSDPAKIDAAIAGLEGPFSSLLNVAGVPNQAGPEVTMRVNFFGLRHFTEAVWDRIAEGGTVVNVASIAGNNWRKRRGLHNEMMYVTCFDAGLAWWQAQRDNIGTDPYTFSKEAVVVYTMKLAGHGLARGIRVNDGGPGPVDTPIFPEFTEDVGDETMQYMVDMVGRPGNPHDIAEALVLKGSEPFLGLPSPTTTSPPAPPDHRAPTSRAARTPPGPLPRSRSAPAR